MLRSSGVDWWSDEMARFKRDTVSALRQPVDCTSVAVMRATRMILTILSHGLPGAAI